MTALSIAVLLGIGLCARAQAPAGESVTAWPLAGVNTAADETAPVFAGGRLGYVRAGGRAKGKRRDRRWLRRYGQVARELRRASLRADGAHVDAGPAGLLAETNGFEGPFALSEDSLRLYLGITQLRGGQRRERIAAAQRGPRQFNAPRPLSFSDPAARELHPALSPDGRLLVFASDRPGGYGGLDLWAASHDGDHLWGEPTNLGPAVNSGADEAYPSWHPGGALYFASRRSDTVGEVDFDLYAARLGSDGERAVERLGAPFASPADDVAIAFDSTGRGGAFASARAGGAGGFDLYGFAYGPRLLAGPEQPLRLRITDARDSRPIPGASLDYVNASSLTLAQALHRGLVSESGGVAVNDGESALADSAGSVDLMTAPGEYHVRASADGFEPADTVLLLGDGSVDATVALRPRVPCVPVSVAVLDAATFDPLPGAQVAFEGQASAGRAAHAADEGGSVRLCLPCGDVYGLMATSTGGLRSRPSVLSFVEEDCGDDAQQVSVTMYVRGGSPKGKGPYADASAPEYAIAAVIALPSVRYDYGSVNLSKEARSDLGHLAELMAEYPDMRVELGSHTDAQGSRAFNAKLSGRRAAEAERYLTRELGVEPGRLRAVGYGESRLLNDCRDGVPCRAREHQVNRRTEITITGVEDPGAIAEALTRRAAEAEESGYAETEAPTGPTVPGEFEAPPRYSADYVADPARPYWVVAGTFRRDAYAERRQRLLGQLGYAGVEVVRFDGSGRRGVIAGKFGSLAEARQFSRAVTEAHRMAAYVRRVD